jgi:hypothetical protein
MRLVVSRVISVLVRGMVATVRTAVVTVTARAMPSLLAHAVASVLAPAVLTLGPCVCGSETSGGECSD